MKIKPVIILLFSMLMSHGQTGSEYTEIDALINTNSMIDAMKALRKLKDEFKKDTLNSEYWLRYSKASYIFYKYEDSERAINKAISLSPGNSVYYFEKGLLLNRTGNTDSSLKSLEKAIQVKPEGEYYYWKGIVNQQLKNNTEAEKDYTTALEKKFETAELHNNFAILLFENEKFPEGVYHINRAIQMDNKYGQAYSVRSKFHLYFLNFDSACIDKSIAYNLGYTKVFNIPDSVCNGTLRTKMKFAGDLYASTGMYQPSIKAYTKLIENNLLHSDYFLNRGYCYYKIKDYANAEKDYLKALELPNPARDMIYDNLSILYFDQNNFLKSIEYSTKRIELNPRNHVPYIDRGFCYRKLKRYKDSEKDYNKSLEIKPDFFRAYGYRSYLYLELGQYEKSLADATRAVEINPKYGYAYLALAHSKQKLSLPDFCVDLYKAKKYGEQDADEVIKEFCK